VVIGEGFRHICPGVARHADRHADQVSFICLRMAHVTCAYADYLLKRLFDRVSGRSKFTFCSTSWVLMLERPIDACVRGHGRDIGRIRVFSR